jgi:REP element-mobilizing transposase RayT
LSDSKNWFLRWQIGKLESTTTLQSGVKKFLHYFQPHHRKYHHSPEWCKKVFTLFFNHTIESITTLQSGVKKFLHYFSTTPLWRVVVLFKEMAKEFYRRNLPHWQPENAVFFVTISLDGSLPKYILGELKAERDYEIKKLKEKGLSEAEAKISINNLQAFYFGKYDDLLDNPQNGIRHLATPEVIKVVTDSSHYLDGKDYKMVCYTIMSNHIHLIIYKLQKPLHKILMSFKGFTGKGANKIITEQGSFWQREYYDRVIRDRKELTEKIRYTLFNPVKAKLVDDWRKWKYSWVREEFEKYAP